MQTDCILNCMFKRVFMFFCVFYVFDIYLFFILDLSALILKCISLGSDKYGDCIRYAEGENKPDLPNGDRFCNARVGWDYEYCIEFKCAPTACAHPLVAPYKKCPYCKGQFKL